MFAHQHDPNAEYKVAGKKQADGDNIRAHIVHVGVLQVHEGTGQQTVIGWTLEDFWLIYYRFLITDWLTVDQEGPQQGQ